MSLLSKIVRTGVHRRPLRICLYGPEGVGKTSFAAGAPSPVFLTNEDGGALLDLAAIVVDTWGKVRDALTALQREKHDYRTVVLDTVDHLERLLIDHILREEEVTSIEAVGGGYGKGWEMVRQEWGRALRELDALRDRGMHIILLGHANTSTVKNPDGADYDQWDLRCNKKTAALFREWPDTVLFANWAIDVKSAEKKADKVLLSKGKAKISDRRIYTERAGGHVAKHRFGDSFPRELDLDWRDFWTAVEAAYARAGANRPSATPDNSGRIKTIEKAATALGCSAERLDEYRQANGLGTMLEATADHLKEWLPRLVRAEGDLHAGFREWLLERDAIAAEPAGGAQ